MQIRAMRIASLSVTLALVVGFSNPASAQSPDQQVIQGLPAEVEPGQIGVQRGQPGQGQSGQFGFAQPGQAQAGQTQPGGMIPDPVRRMLTPGQQGPLVVPPISFVDINSGRFGKLEIDMDDGQFADGACDNLHVTARNLDLKEGVLKSLDVSVTNGHFRDFIVDKLSMSTINGMRFDPGVFLNQKILQFVEPTQADVTCEISQDSLNKFINAPGTLDHLSLSVNKKVGAIASMFGANLPQMGLTLSNGQVVLGKANQIDISLQSKMGMGEMAVAIPIEVTSQLALEDGWVKAENTKLLTSGQEISPQLSQMLVTKVNDLARYAAHSDDIQFKFTDLKVKPGKGLFLRGTATINRLRMSEQ